MGREREEGRSLSVGGREGEGARGALHLATYSAYGCVG